MQGESHAQAQGKHVQAGAGHARTNGPRQHNTREQVRFVCQDKQADKRANKDKVRAFRCKARAHKRDIQCKHLGNGTRLVTVNVPGYDCCACAMILIMSGERGCGTGAPSKMAERRSSAQDTGQTGQASTNKGKTRTGTRKHDTSAVTASRWSARVHSASTSTTPALVASVVHAKQRLAEPVVRSPNIFRPSAQHQLSGHV